MDVTDTAMLWETFMQLNNRLGKQENQMQNLTMQNVVLTTRPASSTRTSPPPRPIMSSLVDTRLLGGPESIRSDPQKFPDQNFKIKAYLGTIDVRYRCRGPTSSSLPGRS
jgi:hypothetical protein